MHELKLEFSDYDLNCSASLHPQEVKEIQFAATSRYIAVSFLLVKSGIVLRGAPRDDTAGKHQ